MFRLKEKFSGLHGCCDQNASASCAAEFFCHFIRGE
jgi:hypothetical protein